MKLTEVKTILLPWPQVSEILSECASKHLGHQIICEAMAEGDDYWSCELKGYDMPLPELCTLMHFSGLPAKDWDDTLPDEGGSTVDGFGMLFCDHLVAHHLNLSWKYRVIGEDGLWLVGVFDKKERQSEPVPINGMEVRFEELKSKDELFNVLNEDGCTHAALMEFCEDYRKRYGNGLCWPYPIMGDACLGEYLVLVKEGVLSLPYTGYLDNGNAVFDLDATSLLQTKQVMQLAADWQIFSQDLLGALCDMGAYLAKQEGDRHETA